MSNLEQYIDQTKSAVLILFRGINSYLEIIHNSPLPVYIGDSGDTKSGKPNYKNWLSLNESKIKSSLDAQRMFSAENFALSILCGSLLQIAYKGIELFSTNNSIPTNLSRELIPLVKSKKIIKFCIGNKLHNVEKGLILYAGRNQYNHFNDKSLNELNKNIFRLIANQDRSFQDPAFDLENEHLISYSANILALLEWNSYESYVKDIFAIITNTD